MEDLQFPRGLITPYLEISHGYSIMKLFKEYLKELHITYADDCCVESDTVLPIRMNGDIIQYYNTFLNEWTDIDISLMITLTTDGISGPATLEGNVLNIPNYAAAQTMSVRAPIGENSFVIPELADKTIISIARSGLTKGIIDMPTEDTEFVQLNGNIITLPVGDIINTVILPDLTEVGELFFIIYY